jgi:hypothetical protein
MSGDIYARTVDVVWRSGPDRVLLHRIGWSSESKAIELTGLVAFIWLAVDEPATFDELVERLVDAEIHTGVIKPDAFRADVHRLVSAGLLVATSAGPSPRSSRRE